MNFKTALGEIVKNPQSFTLFTAPLGWGKTRIIWDLIETNRKIVLLCPLRSIVEEVKVRENTFSTRDEFQKFLRAKKGIFVSTVESFSCVDLDKLIKEHDPLFVFDEFHLFHEWGADFRPILFDSYRDVISKKGRLLAVTATCPDYIAREVRDDCLRNDYCFKYIDVGNFKFQRNPKKLIELNKAQLLRDFEIAARSPFFRGRILLFVKSLEEVEYWFHYCKSKGVSANYCVGGRVKEFEKREETKAKVIISTSVLSHGVNIRNMKKVYISYSPSDSFQTQMLGRGGRFGEKFIGYTIKTSQESTLLSKISLSIKQIYQEFQMSLLDFVL